MVSQSIAWWCFVPEKLTPDRFVRATADAGFPAIDLVPPEYWSLVSEHGLAISAIAAHQPLTIGLNRFDQHDRLEKEIRDDTYTCTEVRNSEPDLLQRESGGSR